MPSAERGRQWRFPQTRRFLLCGLLATVASYGLWVYELRRPARRAEDPAQTLIVEPGWGTQEIGRELAKLGLVRHPAIFRLLVAFRGSSRQLRAGEYLLGGALSLEGVLDKLVRGDVVRRWLVFPEGADIEDMAVLAMREGIVRESFMAAARDPLPIRDLDPEATDLEGYLFPDSYEVSRRPDAAANLVRRMVQRFRDVIEPERGFLAAHGLSLREMVTLASIVEKEAALSEERPRIAAVFFNRLERRMPLQTDPTVIYALKRSGRYDGNIRKEDLEIASPYNTYRRTGLPPGPIASPGRESLRAVLHPAESTDLYFVSRNDGSHEFNSTLVAHERAVNRYQRAWRGRTRRGSVAQGG